MRARPNPPAAPPARAELVWLALILSVAFAARGLALAVLDQPVLSDGAAYLMMARNVVAGREMIDIYGNHALYSPGYPFALVPVMALLGATPGVARGVNLVLGLASVGLLWWLARKATGRPLVALVAAFGLACLVPAIADVEMLERENLSLPLLLAHLCLCAALLDARRPVRLSIAAGLVFGCGLYAGVSTIFTGAAFLLAIAWRGEGWRRAAACVAAFAIACALTIAPYLVRNAYAVGEPGFSTNGGINLYDGNNPAATGYFVDIGKTPIGAHWQQFRAAHGEAGTSHALETLAIDYILANPGHVAVLDLRKLVYFWLPDIPDAGDEDHGAAVTAVRWAGALQHLLILALAIVSAIAWRRWPPAVRLAALAILALWGLQGLFYMITRYRLPAMPLLILLAAIPVADAIERLRRRRALDLG